MADYALHKPCGNGKPRIDLRINAGQFGLDYPAVWVHLTASVWPDGTPRVTSSLTVFCDSGRIKVMLADKAGAQVCFVTADCIEDALVTLELQLQEDRCDWRPEKPKRPTGR